MQRLVIAILFLLLTFGSLCASTITLNSTNPVSGVSIVVSTTVTNAAVTADPANVTALTNSDVEFTATASGNLLSYYWITNGVLAVDGSTLAGATTTSLTLSNVVIGQSNMPVAFIVSNYCTVVTSAVAVLTVTNSPGGGGGGGDTNWVSGMSQPGTLSTDLNVWAGCYFQPAVATNVYRLARWVVSGDSQTHTLVLVDHTAGTIVASNQVNCVGATTNDFLYADLPSPVALNAAHVYYLLSLELASGGDRIYSGYTGYETLVNEATSIAPISGACWVAPGDVLGSATQYAGNHQTYGPVSFSFGP